MKKIFICHTEYHVLITLVKNIVNKQNGKNDIVLYGTLKDINKVYKKLKESNLFDNIYLFNYNDIEEREKLPETKNVIKRRILLKNMIKTYYNFDFLKGKDIYIFNDSSIIGIYLRMSKINYNIIEDGLNCYKNIYRQEDFNSLKYRVKILINDLTCSFGSSKYVKTIEVNSKDSIDVFFKDKFIEIPRKEMFAKLKKNEKEKIINIFFDEQLKFKNTKASLLLTQPLYKDGFLNDKKQQIDMYKYIIDTYMNEKIIIKPHPRDDIDYKQISKDYIILNNSFPVEILNFIENISVEKCITAFSTAIDAIEFCDNKITLGNQWVQKYRIGGFDG